MNRVVHFEIQADDPLRAIDFYEKVFGWEINKWGGPMDYWLVMTGEGPGIDGAIYRREKKVGCDSIIGYVCTVDVSSIDEALEAIKKNSGTCLTSKNHIPGVGWYVQCKDTEGNIFGVMEADKDAKF